MTSMVDALTGTQAWLEAEFEGMLRTIEVEDDCDIPRLQSVATYDLKDLQFPALEILPDRTEVEYSSEGEALDHEHWDIHYVLLLFTYAGQDAREIEYALLRYAEAVDRIVTEDNTAGARFNRVRIGAADYGPMMRSQATGELGQEMRVDLTVRTLHS